MHVVNEFKKRLSLNPLFSMSRRSRGSDRCSRMTPQTVTLVPSLLRECSHLIRLKIESGRLHQLPRFLTGWPIENRRQGKHILCPSIMAKFIYRVKLDSPATMIRFTSCGVRVSLRLDATPLHHQATQIPSLLISAFAREATGLNNQRAHAYCENQAWLLSIVEG